MHVQKLGSYKCNTREKAISKQETFAKLTKMKKTQKRKFSAKVTKCGLVFEVPRQNKKLLDWTDFCCHLEKSLYVQLVRPAGNFDSYMQT